MLKEPENQILIVGIGNEFRGDDAVGIKTAKLLKKKYPEIADYLILESDLSKLIETWEDKHTIIIDAAFSKHFTPGRIHMVCSVEDMIEDKERHYSTHGLGIIEVLHMGKLLNKLPQSLLFIGIEGDNWEFGKSLSPKVEEAIPLVEWRVIDYVMNNLTQGISVYKEI